VLVFVFISTGIGHEMDHSSFKNYNEMSQVFIIAAINSESGHSRGPIRGNRRRR